MPQRYCQKDQAIKDTKKADESNSHSINPSEKYYCLPVVSVELGSDQKKLVTTAQTHPCPAPYSVRLQRA